MGLIQQAHLVEKKTGFSVEKKKIGLLNKVKKSSSYDMVLESFKDFLNSVSAERAGILWPSDEGFFVLLLAKGFDLTTARRFSPSSAFMAKIITQKNKLEKFAGHELDFFSSLFSSNEFNALTALHIRPLSCSDSTVFYLVFAESTLNITRKPLDHADAEREIPAFREILDSHSIAVSSLSVMSAVNQSYASMKTHVESALNSKRIATLAQISFSELFPDLTALQTEIEAQTVFYAIAHRIARQAGSSNITYVSKKFNIRLVIFTTVPVDAELYFTQLMKPLEKIFGTQRIGHIRSEKIGTSTSVPVTMDFITGEA